MVNNKRLGGCKPKQVSSSKTKSASKGFKSLNSVNKHNPIKNEHYQENGVLEAVKFVLEDSKGRILVEERSKHKTIFPGLSSIPAGHIDVKDIKKVDSDPSFSQIPKHLEGAPAYALHAAKRECMEELNIVPKFWRYLSKCRINVSDRKYRVFYYLCKGFDSQKIPKRSLEGAKLKWVYPSNISALPLYIDRSALQKKPAKKLTIAITGTPATGKTTLAKLISEIFNLASLSISKAVYEYNLSSGYDEENACHIVPIPVLRRYVHDFLKKSPSVVIDGHLSHFLSSKKVDLCIVCTSELGSLKKRLEKRAYSVHKVRENLDSEIFHICEMEARTLGHNVLVLDPSKTSKTVLNSLIIGNLKLI